MVRIKVRVRVRVRVRVMVMVMVRVRVRVRVWVRVRVRVSKFSTPYLTLCTSFYGNKVLNLGKDLDSKWFEAYKDLCQAQFNFVASRKDSITKWTGSEDASGA
jgi:hypothetical protein